MENEKLINEISSVFNKSWFKNMALDITYRSNMTSSVSKLMGEAYIYAFATRSCNGIEQYLQELMEIRNPKEKETKRSELILKALAKNANISENEIETNLKLREMFLENYCKNGFVIHTFPEYYFENLNQQGFKSDADRKSEQATEIAKSNEILEIAELFEKHGVIKACGTYPFYEGSGLYVEHDPRKVYEHATLAPEWFFEFTGAEHTGLSSDVAKHPSVTRDYEACKTNVTNLCEMAKLSEEEKKRVMDFFERKWSELGEGQKYAAIIPRLAIQKGDYSTILSNFGELGNSSLISAVINDESKEFQEHSGNVWKNGIPRSDFYIMPLPDAKELYSNIIYKTEDSIEHSSELLQHFQKYAVDSGLNMERVNLAIKRVQEFQERANAENSEISMADIVKAAINSGVGTESVNQANRIMQMQMQMKMKIENSIEGD